MSPIVMIRPLLTCALRANMPLRIKRDLARNAARVSHSVPLLQAAAEANVVGPVLALAAALFSAGGVAVNPTLTKIKRLVLADRILWTLQAENQLSEAGFDGEAGYMCILPGNREFDRKNRS